MKKLLGIVLSAAMLLSMAACGSTAASSAASSAAADSTADVATATDAAASDLKVGVITIGDETEGYTAAHINGIKAAAQKLGMSDSQIVWKYKVPEGAECSDAGEDLVGQGGNLGVPNAYHHQNDIGEEAEKDADGTFVSMTGDFAALTSATNVWEVYYEYLFKSMMDGENPATNWSEGYNEGAVAITDLGPEVAEGTAEKVAEVEAALKDGSLHVFDTSKFTVKGETVTHAFALDTAGDFTPDAEEAVFDGAFHESYFQSAPYFTLQIDGIEWLNSAYGN